MADAGGELAALRGEVAALESEVAAAAQLRRKNSRQSSASSLSRLSDEWNAARRAYNAAQRRNAKLVDAVGRLADPRSAEELTAQIRAKRGELAVSAQGSKAAARRIRLAEQALEQLVRAADDAAFDPHPAAARARTEMEHLKRRVDSVERTVLDMGAALHDAQNDVTAAEALVRRALARAEAVNAPPTPAAWDGGGAGKADGGVPAAQVLVKLVRKYDHLALEVQKAQERVAAADQRRTAADAGR